MRADTRGAALSAGGLTPSSALSTPSPPSDRARIAAGRRLGPYQIEALLDSGGMGAVYRATDTRLGRLGAVKVMAANEAGHADTLRRFEREARTIASLSHPNILSIFDYGRDAEISYAVTELLVGESLRSRLRAGLMPLGAALDIARQVARGLAAAHEKGIVHRDLKPENVFLTADGIAKILDFGLAKITSPLTPQADAASVETRAGLILGTVGYMAPEQVRGQAVDARADVFSFGVLFHEMLTGRRPFDRDSPAEALTAVLRDELPAVDPVRVPPEFRALLIRCMAKDRDARFNSGREILGAVEGLRVPAPRAQGSRTTRRAAIGALFSAAVVTAGSTGLRIGPSARPADRVIPVGLQPIGIAVGGGFVWVANNQSNTVTRIRMEDGEVAGTFPVGDWPASVAWDGRHLWVANHKWLGDHSTVMKLDPADGRVLGTYRVAGQPMHLSTDATHLWVPETWPTYLLRKLRLTDGAEVGAFTAGGAPRQAMSDGESVWVSNGPIQALTRIRAADGRVLGSVPVEGGPNYLARVGDEVWVANCHEEVEKQALVKVRADDLSDRGRISTPGGIELVVSERWIFQSEGGRIVQRRTRDGNTVATWAGGLKPTALIFDGRNLWEADEARNAVTMISGRSLASADS